LEAVNFGIVLGAAQALLATLTSSALVGGGLGQLGRLTAYITLGLTVAALVLPARAAAEANAGRMGRYPDGLPRFLGGGETDGE